MSSKLTKIFMIVQLVVIALLTVSLIYTCQHKKVEEKPLVVDEEYDNGTTHVKTYVSTDLSDLKNADYELYKLIKDIENLESVIKLKYDYDYDTDVQTVIDSNIVYKDSLYHFEELTDTLSYALDVQAKGMDWYRLKVHLSDSLMIINRNQNNVNQVIIEHSDPSQITQVDTWHVKEKKNFSDYFYWGAGAGVGYGLINKKPDIFIGITAGIKF